MRYQRKSAIAYLFRNFWRLAPLSLLAAVALGVFLNTTVESSLFRGLLDGTITQDNLLPEVMRCVSVLRFGKYWWCTLIALVLFILTESILTLKVSQHMHTGEMPLFPIKRSFGVTRTMMLFVFAVCILMEIFNLAAVGIAFLLRDLGPTGVAVLTGVLVYLIRALTMWLVSMLLFAFPIMYLETYSFNQALSYSARLMSERRSFLWFVSLTFPVLRFALTAVCYAVNNVWVTSAVFSVWYLLLIMYVPCVTFRMYYDAIGGDRRDISQIIFER